MTTIEALSRREAHVAVVGLGYVGTPLMAALHHHFSVYGFDTDAGRVAALQRGVDVTRSADACRIGAMRESFTSDSAVLGKCSLIIVAVPTPVTLDHLPDLEAVTAAARTIGRNIRRGTVVIVESTVYPGVTEDVIGSIIADESGLSAGEGGVKGSLVEMGLSVDAITVIPNPIEIGSAGRASESPLAGRYILGVGRLVPEKRFDRLVAAFAMIPDKSLHLVILGEGGERSKIVDLGGRVGVYDRVHLMGSVREVEPWYSHTICFVLRSRNEGRPSALAEAMAMGCTVVSFGCLYGPSEMIEHESNGLLVVDSDIRGLSCAVTRVLADSVLSEQISTQARAWAASFEASKVANTWWDE